MSSKRKIQDYFGCNSNKKASVEDSSIAGNDSRTANVECDNKVLVPMSADSEANNNSFSCISKSTSGTEMNSFAENLPSCWTVQQGTQFLQKNPWLVFKDKKLGCQWCQSVSYLGAMKSQGLGIPIDNKWANVRVGPNGDSKFQQQKSLRKKICEHRACKTHRLAEKIKNDEETNKLPTVVSIMKKDEQVVTERIFRTAYNMAKQNRPFYEFEKEVDVQVLNGINMGKILHSNVSAMNIINHISENMQESLAKKIVEDQQKFALILDESTSLSNNACLILYVRTQLSGMENPGNLFLSVKQLDDSTANGILSCLMGELRQYKIDDDILRKHLVSITCDGASVMLGKKSGLCKLLLDKFPDIIVWHCLNHRLELSVGDAVNLVAGIDHFKIFMDKLRNIYHNSPKNQRELNGCAARTEQALLKIGRVLDSRWVASSLRSVKAVWNDYFVLCEHFSDCSKDIKRDSKERATFSSLAKKLATDTFVLNLGLLYDALQELSELSLELQNRNTTVVDAHRLICLQIQLFESRISKPGKYALEAIQGVKDMKFKQVCLHESTKSIPRIQQGQLYRCLVDSVKSRLLSVRARNIGTGFDEIIKEIKVLSPKFWPDSSPEITYGEEEVENLCMRFHLNERETLRGFRIFKNSAGKEVPPALRKLMSTVNCIPVSSAECERGFSAMNLICTPQRVSLHVKTLSNLMFIRLVGPSLRAFEPASYVRSWLAAGHRSAIDNQSKKRKEQEEDPDTVALWRIFQ